MCLDWRWVITLSRQLPDLPDIEPAGLGNVYFVEHAAVGHAAPAEREIGRHERGEVIPAVVGAAQHARGQCELRQRLSQMQAVSEGQV